MSFSLSTTATWPLISFPAFRIRYRLCLRRPLGKDDGGRFFKRRLIRLHPMIIVGMVVGAITFFGFQGNDVVFPNINSTPFWKMLLVFLVGCT